MILFDSHWNPAVDLQAIYRCYRYGQTKSVFAYRFLTEGTMEDKIYSRSVNKSGLAARVIDQKHPERAFTGAELNDILATNTMVCCELWYVLNEFEVCEASQFIFLSFLRHLPSPPIHSIDATATAGESFRLGRRSKTANSMDSGVAI